MQEEIILNDKIPEEKIYKDWQVWSGALLGGPLTAGYLISRNFKQFGESRKASISIVLGILATVIVFGLAFSLPEGFPDRLLPLLYTAAAFLIVRIYQGPKIKRHIENGGPIESWWKTIGLSIIGILLSITPILAFVFLTLPTEEAKTYGKTQNEITYQKGNITESEVDSIAEALRKTGFFGDEYKGYMYVVKSGSAYQLSINFNNAGEIDSKRVEDLTGFRREIQQLFPNNKIILNLVVYDIDNVIKQIE